MRRSFLACSNCDQVAADSYWWLADATVLIAAVLAVVLLVRLRHAGIRWRAFGVLALLVLALGVVLSLGTLARRTQAPQSGSSVICGSALSAARTTGVPDDSALDKGQLACRAAGRTHLRAQLPTDATILMCGLLAAAVSIVGTRREALVPTYA